ncbi:MAG: sugar ABC transporter ATP-binding protein, partial [Desulfurococcaceae archaeon]
MNEKVLVMSNIKKSFPGVQALKGVSIELRKGEILGLVGENGAGKSTLLKILTGVLHPDEGHIILRGKEVKIRNPQHAFSLGIAYVPQETNLYPNLSVAENMFLGVVTKGGWKRIKYNDLYIKAREYLSILGVEDLDPSLKVGQLSASMQQIVMIARALAARAEIFVLDEPTSALTPFEVNRLFSILRKLRDSGYSVIFVSHRLEEVLEISDRITVLRDGLKVAEYDLKESKVTIDDVVKAMIAREIKEFYPKEPVPIGDVILEVKNLSGPNISNINFHLRSGEILGVFGLLGSGIIELGLLLGGVIPATSGEIFVKGKKIHIS